MQGVKGTGSKAERNKKWLHKNPGYMLEKQRAWRVNNPGYLGPKRQANVDRINAMKEVAACADCGNSFPTCCMDFDHVGADKYEEVGTLVSRSAAWDIIAAEIAKCEIVCANCHRIRTRDKGSSAWTRKTLEKDEMSKQEAERLSQVA